MEFKRAVWFVWRQHYRAKRVRWISNPDFFGLSGRLFGGFHILAGMSRPGGK